MQAFVDAAHKLGLAVIVDTVLHHGAVDGNELWDYDGWGANMDGAASPPPLLPSLMRSPCIT